MEKRKIIIQEIEENTHEQKNRSVYFGWVSNSCVNC